MEKYNTYINNIYNNIINVSKLSLNNTKQENLKKMIKIELTNFIQNNKLDMNKYDQHYIINNITEKILNKLKKKDEHKMNYYDIKKPINTRESFNVDNFSNYKQQRNELFNIKNPEEINFSDPSYKPKIKSNNTNNETLFSNNDNNKLDNYYSNIDDDTNDDNIYKIDFQDNKNYEDEETLEQRLIKINQEREILNVNNNDNKNNELNTNNKQITTNNKKITTNNNDNKKFNFTNNSDFNINDIQEILVLTTNKIQELTILYNELNKKVDRLYNKK